MRHSYSFTRVTLGYWTANRQSIILKGLCYQILALIINKSYFTPNKRGASLKQTHRLKAVIISIDFVVIVVVFVATASAVTIAIVLLLFFFLFFCFFLSFLVLWEPIFKMHPQNTSVYLNDGVATVTLECAADGSPLPVISWLKNNSIVINETVFQNGSVSSITLAFHEISKQAPKYRCVARNSVGNTLSKEAAITIAERSTKFQKKGRLHLYKPRVTANDQLYHCKRMSDVLLFVQNERNTLFVGAC